MIKKVILMILGCLFCFNKAYAHEYAKLNDLIVTLKSDYIKDVNFKDISLKGIKLVSEFDDELKIYNSDTKLFLYDKNNLVETFKLPTEVENADSWQNLFVDVLKICSKRSIKLQNREAELEDRFIQIIMTNLDTYSRMENNIVAENPLSYSFKHGILYIKPHFFNNSVADYIKKIVLDFPEAEGLILDLKGNHGGSFNAAIQTVDLFLDNSIITYRIDKKQRKHFYTATEGDIFSGKPIVVLVDGETASAAELVAAAFGEQSRAILVGTKTFGKGSVQNTYKRNEHVLLLTSGLFFTPSGKPVDMHGVMPQICVGADNSCSIADDSSSEKGIKIAIALIKKNLG